MYVYVTVWAALRRWAAGLAAANCCVSSASCLLCYPLVCCVAQNYSKDRSNSAMQQRPAAFLLLMLAELAAVTDGTTLVNATSCSDGQVHRPCTTFELNPDACLCPGKGPVRRFVLDIVLANVTNVPGADPNKTLVSVNGTYPGPKIYATEGDWLEVTVRNRLPAGMPSVVHWHGQFQVLTPFSDGVPGITQCAIPSGSEVVYAFATTDAGTYWYHGEEEGLRGAWAAQPPSPPSGARLQGTPTSSTSTAWSGPSSSTRCPRPTTLRPTRTTSRSWSRTSTRRCGEQEGGGARVGGRV